MHVKKPPYGIHHIAIGPEGGHTVIWAHGWGQSHAAFLPLAQSLEPLARHILIDFPGFGASPPPPEIWSTADYADAAADFIRDHAGGGPVTWIGHSFGCRVGIQIAARHPDLIKNMVLIAAAGLKPRRPLHRALYIKSKIMIYKTLKKLAAAGMVSTDWLHERFGSADYKTAGPMRAIFVKIVNEDLGTQAEKIKAPVRLIYGANDTETPPEMGRRLHALIRGSELTVLQGQDHYSVLGAGQHQVAPILKKSIMGP